MRGSEWWAAGPDDLSSDAWHDYVIDAVERGCLYWRWRDLQVGPLTVCVMTAPLAVGTDEDHVHLYGMSAALADRILLAWNRTGGSWHDSAPAYIMTPTSLILDVFAADQRAVMVGPFTDTPGTMSKAGAKLHSERLREAQRTAWSWESDSPMCPTAWEDFIGDWFWPEFKTYTLRPRPAHIPKGYACEYGWHVGSGWYPSATGSWFARQPNQHDLLEWDDTLARRAVTRVIQYEHYRGCRSQDYSMAAWYMSAHGTLRSYRYHGAHGGKSDSSRLEETAERVDLRELLADPDRAHLVTVHGPQDWHIHPEALR